MAGINLNQLAAKKGILPRMGLEEAMEMAKFGGTPCPVCKVYPESTFQQTMVYRYGMCSKCLQKEG